MKYLEGERRGSRKGCCGSQTPMGLCPRIEELVRWRVTSGNNDNRVGEGEIWSERELLVATRFNVDSCTTLALIAHLNYGQS